MKDILLKEREIDKRELIYLLCGALSITKERLFLEIDRPLREEEIGKIRLMVERRKEGEPLAYIKGMKEFFSEDFEIDRNVLVPRPETEIVVEEALERLLRKDGPKLLLDMGAGSGNIGIVIAKRVKKKAILVDISLDALKVAKRNAERHGVLCSFVCSDLFSALKRRALFDMILANLPYVSEKEFKKLSREVRDFEPELALLGGKNGFELYERFLKEAPYFLKEDGCLICEIGGRKQAGRARAILKMAGFEVDIKKDIGGRERVIIAWRNL